MLNETGRIRHLETVRMGDSADCDNPTPRPTAVGALAFPLIWIPYVLLVRHFWFVADDAFISFRYARNLALGNGLRYNLGTDPPVEGYSNFLWVMVCSVFEWLHLDMTIWPLLLSTACGTAILWMIFDLTRRRLELGTSIAFLATLSLACFPPFALWSTSGMETMPFALLVLLTFERLVLRRGSPDPIGGSIAGLLLALIRLDGIAWFAVILVLALLSRRMAGERIRRAAVTLAIIVVVGYACYYGWRYAYYQVPLPNTAYAKAELDVPRLMRGVNYVWSHVLVFISPILLIPASVVALRRRRIAIGLPTAGLAWAFPAYSILVTGDFMPMGRFLVPSFAFNALLLAWLLYDLWTWSKAGRVAAVAVAVIALAVALPPAWNRHLVPESIRERFRFRFNIDKFRSEYEQWEGQVRHTETWTLAGKMLRSYVEQREFADPHPSLAMGGIGVVGYYSWLNIYDQYGLVTPKVARREIEPDEPLRSPGHDKGVERAYFAEDEPTIMFGQGKVAAPQSVAQTAIQVGRQLRDLQRDGRLPKCYAPDVARVDVDLPIDGVAYLIAWVHVPNGSDPAVAWERFREKVRTLQRGEHLPPVE